MSLASVLMGLLDGWIDDGGGCCKGNKKKRKKEKMEKFLPFLDFDDDDYHIKCLQAIAFLGI